MEGGTIWENDIPCTEENRRAYREMLFTTPGLKNFISGVILFDETMRQRNKEGVLFPEVLMRQGILPGVREGNDERAICSYIA